MMFSFRRSPLVCLFCVLFFVSQSTPVESFSSRNNNRLFQFQRTYFGGPIPAQTQKFLGGAVLGYVGSKVAIRSSTMVLKGAAVVWVATEALHAAGVFDVNEQAAKGIQRTVMLYAKTLQRNLHIEQIREAYRVDPSGPMGLALGVVMGCLS
eukprot:Nitzschia sp. Nitz4//scaffold401_size10831//9893//10520//NITZ4_009059-RA/size10831-augustus-gene-0.11-mRNA-1//1//CDS//3329551072//1933//frame0